MRRAALCGLIALILPAGARAATGAEVRSLAARAESSPAALAQLRAIDTVDGRRVDLRAALRTSNAAELEARLRALAGGGAAPAAVGDPSSQARAILAESRFHGSSVPRPLHGFLVWLGDRLQPVADAFRWVGDRFVFGRWGLGAFLAALVVAVSAFVALKVARRRGASTVERRLAARYAGLDPAQLEREADAAEAQDDPAQALRLRYRAGLLRLGRARVLPLRESLTTAEARRALGLPSFDTLARTHDEVVFGGRIAVPQDAVDARSGWRDVLGAKGVRS
jgi:hypothetical protein